ncbi:hypothetical protein ElyMa_006520200 [Elysia marginata]|uniref:Cysteine-rich DPF motif domain-containing protein 1 n=1 Tax=Elysia marginata TaxID=1093978 RepID=A0AAV4I549_9GAST|nr:hypothetical protein ElyMa_006520200 [Elysia marginata]
MGESDIGGEINLNYFVMRSFQRCEKMPAQRDAATVRCEDCGCLKVYLQSRPYCRRCVTVSRGRWMYSFLKQLQQASWLGSNLQPPDHESDELTTEPRCSAY